MDGNGSWVEISATEFNWARFRAVRKGSDSGHMTPDEWAILAYKHLDHHLRQFGT
jgi:hypothetical protein